jgi:hypothetical protein
VLLFLGVLLPWLSWPGGSANLLTGGEMRIVYQAVFSTEEALVGNSTMLLIALVSAAAGIALPLLRTWDTVSKVLVTVVGLVGVVLFQLSTLVPTDDAVRVIVGGDTVAQTASVGIGVYAAAGGAFLLFFAGGGGLLSVLRARLGI